MEENNKLKNIESEELLRIYGEIDSFVKFLDSEKQKCETEETDE